MKTMVTLTVILLLAGAGCAAKKVETQGMRVQYSFEKPEGTCKKIGDVVGTQGNWLTGGYTSNKNLLEGSINDMRNQAGAMGGTHIWIHQQHLNTGMGSNTVNSTVMGTVYKCE